MHWITIGLVATSIMATRATAADVLSGRIAVSAAWTPALSETRGDTAFYLTIANHADAPDALIRVRCPTDLADATEKHTIDHGEGGAKMREVASFTIPANGTVTLAPGGDHLMLLHVREPLREGQTFACSLAFRSAGTLPVEVRVAASDAKAAP